MGSFTITHVCSEARPIQASSTLRCEDYCYVVKLILLVTNIDHYPRRPYS